MPSEHTNAAPETTFWLLKVKDTQIVHHAAWQRVVSMGCALGDVLILMAPDGAKGVCSVARDQMAEGASVGPWRADPVRGLEEFLILEHVVSNSQLKEAGLLPSEHEFWGSRGLESMVVEPAIATGLLQSIRGHWEGEEQAREIDLARTEIKKEDSTRSRRRMLPWIAVNCLVVLVIVDGVQEGVSDVSKVEVRRSISEGALQSNVRQCLQSYPLWAREKAQTQATSADQIATTEEEAKAALAEKIAVRKCEIALQAVEEPEYEDWHQRTQSFVEDLFHEGSSANLALRLLKLVLLGVFALAVSELVLTHLKRWGLPVASLDDLAKLTEKVKPEKKTENKSEGGSSIGIGLPRLMSLVGTTVITGVTGAAIVGPELVQQVVSTSRVSESKVLDTRSIQSQSSKEQFTIKDHTTDRTTDRSVGGTELIASIASLNFQMAELKGRVDIANERVFHTQQVVEAFEGELAPATIWAQRQAETASRIDHVTQTSGTDLSTIRKEVEGLGINQSKGFYDQRQWLVAENAQLKVDVHDALVAASQARQEVVNLSKSEKQRSCAVLAYFEHLDKHRMAFKGEAQERLQRLRDIMKLPEPTADCNDSTQAKSEQQAQLP